MQAARIAVPLHADKPKFQSKLLAHAWDQLHWILGRDSFDTTMLMGRRARLPPSLMKVGPMPTKKGAAATGCGGGAEEVMHLCGRAFRSMHALKKRI
jgi:hypothetical protein